MRCYFNRCNVSITDIKTYPDIGVVKIQTCLGVDVSPFVTDTRQDTLPPSGFSLS